MECLYLIYFHYAEASRGAIPFNQDPNVGLVSYLRAEPAVTEHVFVASYKQILSPKTGCITKEGLETRASNLMLILIVTHCEGIRNYFMQRYASILPQEPNLLSGIFNEKYLANYTERHVRWSYNKVFLHFIETIQRLTEAQSHYGCLFHQTPDIKQLASYRNDNDTVFAIDNHTHSIYLQIHRHGGVLHRQLAFAESTSFITTTEQ